MATFWKRKTGKKSERVRAKNRCLVLWSKIIRHRQPMCQYCYSKPTEAAHHIVTRQTAVKPFWFDLQYGIGLCKSCHATKAHSTDVYAQMEFLEFVKIWLGKKGFSYDTMRALARQHGGIDLFGLLQTEKELKEIWKTEQTQSIL